MSYLDHDGLAYFKSKLDRTFIADIVFDDGDILLYGGDGTLLKTVVQEGTVTQKKSTTNKEYPILLCWDADAEEDQTMKTVWYGLDARINPKFGYLYARRYYTEHPSYERTNAPTARAEWHHMFTDAVSAPMGEVYEYLDRNSDGGEHRMELRLYGNPLSQYVDTPNHNEATDAVSLGVGATRGEKLTFFGYAPSTPIYLENGTTMRKSTVRGDQYGKDIITRDWLNLNGSITGLVHTYMDETIDGYKTFLKTVTIDSGNDNAKAGLNVQGDVNIDSGDNTKPSNLYVQGNSHTHGNETVDGKLTANGTAEIKGGSGNTPSLTVTGNEYISGNSNVHGSLDVDTNLNVDGTSNLHGAVTAGNGLAVTGNETVSGTLTVGGKITGNGGAEISGGSGLKVNGNETVTGNLTVGGTTTTKDLTVTDDATIGDDLTVNGDTSVAGTINKKTGNTTQEYVTYVTSQDSTRKNIAAGLIDTSKGLAYNSSTGKIYVNLGATDAIAKQSGLVFSNGALKVDFSQMDDSDLKADILAALDMQYPLDRNLIGANAILVDPGNKLGKGHTNDLTHVVDGKTVKYTFKERRLLPFDTITAAVNWVASSMALGTHNVDILVVGTDNANSPRVFNETVVLPEVNTSSGSVAIKTYYNKKDVVIDPGYSSTDGHTLTCITANKGACRWSIYNLHCKLRIHSTTTPGYAPCGIGAHTPGAIVNVYGCTVESIIESDTLTGEGFSIRMIEACAGGQVHLFPDDLGSKIISRMPTTDNTTSTYNMLDVNRDGRIYFRRSTNSENGAWECSGSCTNVINAWQSAGTNLLGGAGTQVAFVVASGQSVTGNRYRAQTGSYIMGPASGFPGQEAADVSTVVASSKGCWVSGVNPA